MDGPPTATRLHVKDCLKKYVVLMVFGLDRMEIFLYHAVYVLYNLFDDGCL